METTRTVLAGNVRRLRLLRGWSQEQLAERCGLHRTYVGAIERGERNIGLDNLERLAHSLEVSAARLLTHASVLPEPGRIREPRIRYHVRPRLKARSRLPANRVASCRISAPMCYS